MYLPRQFHETRIEVLHDLMRGHPLATLVSLSPDGLTADHIPLHFSGDPSPLGSLSGHLALANPLLRHPPEGEVLAVFHGPQAYVTPSWYPSKRETGKAVPTWNYAVVHAHGRLSVRDDRQWLRAHLETLTEAQEAAFPHPWRLSDAPTDYIEKLMAAAVGIEITLTRLSGKWKTSQNQLPENRVGVVRGLTDLGDPESLAMAALVESCLP